MNITDYFKDTIENSRLWSAPQFPFKAHIGIGHPRVAIVAGDNGTGKSLLVQILSAYCGANHDLLNVTVSIRERTGSGLSDMAGMRRAMMFGDEHEESTGAVSTRVLEPAFNTMKSRAEEGKKAVLILDEPELGLSDAYAGAMGTYIAQRACGLPELCAGVVVVSHSRTLVKALGEALGRSPSFIKLGSKQTLTAWLKGDSARSVADLLSLPKVCHENKARVHSVIESFKK